MNSDTSAMTAMSRITDFIKCFYSVIWIHDILVTAAVLALSTMAAGFLSRFTASFLSTAFIYMLAIVIAARFTTRYIYGIISSCISIICINYFFTYPYMHIDFTIAGYPVAFFSMLFISILTSMTTSRLKTQSARLIEREKQLAEAEKERIKANLLRAISHDLRTPLTTIIGSADLYLSGSPVLSESDRTALIGNIQEDANWLLTMVENILSVTRLNAENAAVRKKPEPVEEVLSEAVFRLKKRFADAEINVRIPDEFLMIPMDALLIEQVIINLLENAIVHSGSVRPIDCFVTAEPETVSFHIRDFGVGIAPEKIPFLFEGKGSSASERADRHRGMGIGLSICKSIITAHHGEIHACQAGSPANFSGSSTEDCGTEFCFSLPRQNFDIHQTEGISS